MLRVYKGDNTVTGQLRVYKDDNAVTGQLKVHKCNAVSGHHLILIFVISFRNRVAVFVCVRVFGGGSWGDSVVHKIDRFSTKRTINAITLELTPTLYFLFSVVSNHKMADTQFLRWD